MNIEDARFSRVSTGSLFPFSIFPSCFQVSVIEYPWFSHVFSCLNPSHAPVFFVAEPWPDPW